MVTPNLVQNKTLADISPRWLSVIRRLKSLGRQQRGLALIKLVVLVDERGEPQIWTAPTLQVVEPLASAEELLKRLPKEQLEAFIRGLGDEL